MDKLETWSQLLDQIKNEYRITSDAELGRRIGVSRSYVSAIRVGRKAVSFEQADKLFKLLGMNLKEHVNVMFLPEDMCTEEDYSAPLLSRRAEVLARAENHCELCFSPAPFKLDDGSSYLEFTVLNINSEQVEAALCPNCHKKVTLLNNEEDMQMLLKNIKAKNA